MDGIEYLLTKINEEIENLEESISRGNAVDYAQYQNLCGQVRGLLRAGSIINDLRQRMEKDDD